MSKILIVDDSSDGAEVISRFLTNAGHTVRLIANGKGALAEVIQNTPDAVLLDLFLPELDGPSFLEIVRAYLRLDSLPIVVLTGLPDSPLIDRIKQLSVSAVLVKGKASLDDVRQALEQAISHVVLYDLNAATSPASPQQQ
jgi:CheY-like chemotaxis protein